MCKDKGRKGVISTSYSDEKKDVEKYIFEESSRTDFLEERERKISFRPVVIPEDDEENDKIK